MSLNKYGKSQKDNQGKIAAELSAFSHDDVTVEEKKDGNNHIDTGGGGLGRDRRDTGH
ncbi:MULTISPECIES: hypothetical protein [Pantoea]|uniref:hypothetical protein n=1 Tax=Pantoea TaxID=53335 RepID=UPI000D93AD9A|nr:MULTISPECIES: hypothetical protein [Pantoea]MDI3366963.1 hypothetical protein [Pantoea sp. V108_6]PXV97026.1 hypothetical protein C7422_1147 [Pantoea ananatis]